MSGIPIKRASARMQSEQPINTVTQERAWSWAQLRHIAPRASLKVMLPAQVVCR